MYEIDHITEKLRASVREIPDFPVKGIQFKDITTMLKDPALFRYALNEISDYYQLKGVTKVVAIESRGFIMGGAIAGMIGAGFVPIRKPGKLPWKKYSKTYQLEYGADTQEIHQDALSPEDVVLLHDDLLATGGTTKAALSLIETFDVSAVYLNYLIELRFLNGRERLGRYDIFTLIQYD